MLKTIYKKKIIALFLCSWIAFASNSAIAMPPRWYMDCASFGANIAKIIDTVCKFFSGNGNGNGNNNTQRATNGYIYATYEEIIVERIEHNEVYRRNGNITNTTRTHNQERGVSKTTFTFYR